MTVQTICDRCGMEYTWAGVTVGDQVYCCAGCASGGPCTCPFSAAVASHTARTTVVTDSGAVVSGRPVTPPDDVIIVD